MKKKLSHLERAKWLKISYWIVLLAILMWGLFFDRYSFYQRYRTSRQFKQMEANTRSITAQNDSLRRVNRQLKTSPVAVEKIAREKLGYLKPGEKVYRFISSPADSTAEEGKKGK